MGRRLSASFQDPRETSFLFQRLSVAITRFSFWNHFVSAKIRTSSHRGYFVFSFLLLALESYSREGIR